MRRFKVFCVRCKVELDPLLSAQMSVGMTGQACMKCGLAMEKEQLAKITKFTEEAERRGLVVRTEVDGAGHATLIATPPPPEELDERGDEEAAPEGSENDQGAETGGESSGKSPPGEAERPQLLRKPEKGEKA